MKKGELINLLIRYTLLIVLAVPNLYLFYAILTPLTTFPVFIILNILFGAELLPNNIISFQGVQAQIIPACVAGAAYYLLLILNLSTPMNRETRIKSIIFLFGAFLILNIIRIITFATLILYGFQYFNLTHTLTWYFGSTLLIVVIWFANVKIFKIKNIPIYTDLKSLYKQTKSKKKSKKKRKK